MNLSDIFCQDKAVEKLSQAFACGRTPHAYIFEGIDGIGKYTTAKAFTKLLLCMSPVKNDSCGKCESCKMFDADNHPDFHHIYKELVEFSSDAALRKKQPIDLPIDVIREFLIQKIQIRPSLSVSKVFVVSEAEKLNNASQNALLKVLEEPPNKSFIILLCSKLENLLPTTKSRSQIVHFGPIGEERIIEKLHGNGVDKQQAKYLARLSCGSIGQAELWAKLEPSFYESKKELLEKLCKFKLVDAVDLAQWISSSCSDLAESWQKLKTNTSKSDISRQVKKVFVSILAAAFVDAMKISFAGDDEITNFDQPMQIKKIAQSYGQQNCAKMVEQCYETIRFIDASVNEKLIFEHLLLNCADSGIIKV